MKNDVKNMDIEKYNILSKHYYGGGLCGSKISCNNKTAKKKSKSSSKSSSKSKTPQKKDTNLFYRITATQKNKIIPDTPPKSLIERKRDLEQKIKSPAKRLSNMLSVVCKDPVYCIALGKYNEYLKEYFAEYKELDLVDYKKISSIGVSSGNGFVLQLPFKRPGTEFTAYTALKCAARNSSDNLYYEYYVGKHFINEHSQKFPCFVETYGAYRFVKNSYWEMLYKYAKNRDADILPLFRMLNVSDNIGWKNSCVDSKHLCVLIQYFNNIYTFSDYVNNAGIDKIGYDIFGMMYQIYFPLQILGATYTHYDLHQDNVLLYKPFGKKKYYTEMNYHLKSGKIIKFPTEFICKIIDYGRNYFNNKKRKMDTRKIMTDYVCKYAECEPRCGEEAGYKVIQGRSYNPDKEFKDVYPDRPNISQDLRLINSIEINDRYTDEERQNYEKKYPGYKLSKNVKYFQNYCTIIYKDIFGTPEIVDNTVQVGTLENYTDPSWTPEVRNINDVRAMLELYIDYEVNNVTMRKYANWKKAGVMHIYEDGRDYEFISVLVE